MSGIWNLWYGVNTFLALALVGLFFAIPYRRLRLTTVSQLFIERYGKSRSSILTSLCVQTEYLIINIIEPFVIGLIVSSVTGIPLVWGIFPGAVVIISYTATSGLRGTAITNIIHCLVVIVGLAAVGIVVMQQMGGWDVVVERATTALVAADMDVDAWWSFLGMGWLPVIAMFFSATIHTPAASVYVNYSTSAKSERLLIPAFLLAGVIAATMPFLSGIIGIEAVARRITSVVYGLVAAGIAAVANITSVLELLLLGFAMVVPPAVAIAFILYWRRTTEQGAFWGIAMGYGTGLVAFIVNETIGGGPDPSYWTTLVPLLVVPLVSLMTQAGEDPLKAGFYQRLSTRSEQ